MNLLTAGKVVLQYHPQLQIIVFWIVLFLFITYSSNAVLKIFYKNIFYVICIYFYQLPIKIKHDFDSLFVYLFL